MIKCFFCNSNSNINIDIVAENIVLGKMKLLGNIVAKDIVLGSIMLSGETLSDRDPIYPRSIPFNALNHNTSLRRSEGCKRKLTFIQVCLVCYLFSM